MTDRIDEKDLPRVSPAPTDLVRIVRGDKSVMGPASGLPVPAAAQAQINALRDGQAAGQKVYRTWSELSAITGGAGEGAQVIDDSGTHTDPVVGGTVANAGQYVWSESPAGWRWVRPDGLALKADTSALAAETAAREAVLSPFSVPGYRLAVGDFTGIVLGIKDDGTTVIGGLEISRAAMERLAVSDTIDMGSAQIGTVLPSGFRWGISDDQTQLVLGVNDSGEVEVGTLVAKRIEADSIAGWSDKSAGVAGFMTGLMHVISYGQSLSTGVNASPIQSSAQRFGAVQFNGGALPQYGSGGSAAANRASLAPLALSGPVTTANGTAYEVPVVGMTDSIYERLLEENEFAVADLTLLASAPGEGSQSIAALSKGGTYYQQLVDDVTYGYARAQEVGKSYAIMGVSWVQGETDQSLGTSASTYISALAQLQDDINADVSSIVGESVDIPWFLYQFNSWINRTPNTAYPTIPLALQEAARTLPNTYLACPMYMLDYADQAHLNGPSSKVMGAYLGLAQKRVVVDGRTDFEPLWVKDHKTQGKVCTIKLNPVGRLVVDTTQVSNPGNYGFSMVDSGGSPVPISSVSVGLDTVTIVASSNIPSGAKLRYAFIGGTTGQLPGRTTGPRGNIRDSQGDTIVFDPTGINWPMHNWLVPFELTIN